MTELPQAATPSVKPIEGVARRRFLAWSSTAILGALAFSGRLPGFSIEQAFAAAPGGATGKAVDLGEGDVGVLNYAYALEQLEAAFYSQAVKTPYANMQSADRDMLTAIRDHELAHRDFFKAALKKNAIPALEVDFTKIDFNSRDSVLSTAATFENLGVAAYNGAGQLLQKPEYLLLAGKIVSVEARHAAAIRHLIGMKQGGEASSGSNAGADSPVNDKGLDQALSPAEVLPKAAPFVKNQISADDVG